MSAAVSFGQTAAGKPVTVTAAVVKPERLMAGGKATLTITVAIAPGFHVNGNKPDDENAVPTVLELDAPPKGKGISFGRPVYPEPKMVPVGYSPKPIRAYDGTIVLSVPIVTDAKVVRPGRAVISGQLRYQSCNATSCFRPTSAPISASFTVNGVK